MRHEAEVLHRLPGRTRIRLLGLKGKPDALERVMAGLQSLPGVEAISANPLTASLLIRHGGNFDELSADAAATGLLQWVERTQAPLDLQGHFNQGLRQFDRNIQSITAGSMDFNGLLILAFAALAIQQAIEGQVVVPAATALWYTLGAAQRPKESDPLPGSLEKGQNS